MIIAIQLTNAVDLRNQDEGNNTLRVEEGKKRKNYTEGFVLDSTRLPPY